MKKTKAYLKCTVHFTSDESKALGGLFDYRKVHVKGKEAKTLLHLMHHAEKGITALEMSNTWALRLAAYVHSLRKNHGLNIDTVKEPHEDGYHARYVLKDAVKINERNF